MLMSLLVCLCILVVGTASAATCWLVCVCHGKRSYAWNPAAHHCGADVLILFFKWPQVCSSSVSVQACRWIHAIHTEHVVALRCQVIARAYHPRLTTQMLVLYIYTHTHTYIYVCIAIKTHYSSALKLQDWIVFEMPNAAGLVTWNIRQHKTWPV
jgi:hypothetical protein